MKNYINAAFGVLTFLTLSSNQSMATQIKNGFDEEIKLDFKGGANFMTFFTISQAIASKGAHKFKLTSEQIEKLQAMIPHIAAQPWIHVTAYKGTTRLKYCNFGGLTQDGLDAFLKASYKISSSGCSVEE